jgi:hypothetical protein
MARPGLAVVFGILCCISIALVIASLWVGAAAILAVGFAAAFAGLVGCGP